MSKKKVRFRNFEGISFSVFERIRYESKRRKLDFKITIEDVAKKFKEQNGICNLSGRILKLKRTLKDTIANASLDRIDSTKGYLPDNIQWVDKEINKLKSSLPQEKFLQLCKEISKNLTSSSNTMTPN